MTVVTPGEKSGEIRGANQYSSITFWARAKERDGVTIVISVFIPLTPANEGISTTAEERVASVTLTGSDECVSKAFLSSAAGSAMFKKTALCSRRERSYCISTCASPSGARVMERDCTVNACTGSIAAVRIQNVTRAKENVSMVDLIEVEERIIKIIWMGQVQQGKLRDEM
jgi:hypothetical protein